MTNRRSLPGPHPDLAALLASHPPCHIHLVGIGGTGLSAIARVLLGRGYTVSGSDARASQVLAELAAAGATVYDGHQPEQIAGANLVLVSSAVAPENPEVVAAQAAGIAVVKREQFLAPLMAGFQAICVAGTHGKTTTSAMLATMLDGLGAEPAFIVGSDILNIGTNARAGRTGGPFILEADEYDRMFLGLQPDIAVVTNVEWDHVDCYPNPDSYQHAFQQFTALVLATGTIIYCQDDPGARRLREATSSDAMWVSYGLGDNSHWRALNLSPNPIGGTDFDLVHTGRLLGRVSLAIPGQHNVLNALATLAAVEALGYVFIEGDENLKVLQKYAGTARRLEQKGEGRGIIVVDDYAHHPTEVRATLSAARQRFPRRAIWVMFQPHTFSRTRALLSEFCESFENADHVLITDIYAAREHDTMGVSAQDLVSGLTHHPDARYAGNLDAAAALLLAELRPGDVLLTLGAGDSYRVGEQILAALQSPVRHGPGRPTAARYDRLAAAIEEAMGLVVLRSELLANHTTMRVGGPADLFVTASTLSQLLAILALGRQNGVSTWLLGGGSNVLVSDAGVRGLVIANGCRELRRHQGDVVWAESGANLAGLARQTVRWGLSGLEWGVSVPGTVGGAVVGNAGAHGGSVADNLLRATLVQADGHIVEWPAARFQFGYRHSLLKEQIRAGERAPAVLSAAFQLAQADAALVEARAAEFLAYRRATQPVEPSAGSIFQNPPGDYAGRILDSLGFKGRRHGGAAFSTRHANFIVNHGGATAADVLYLIDEARETVWRQMTVALVPEIHFVGDWPQQPPYRALPGPETAP